MPATGESQFTVVSSLPVYMMSEHTVAAMGPFKCYVGGVSFPGKSVIKVYGSTLLALRGGGWGSNFQEKKRYVTLEWPLTICT